MHTVCVGVPKEIKDHEERVALTPDGARSLVESGSPDLVETSAGLGSGFPDRAYASTVAAGRLGVDFHDRKGG